jgi:hypothetical protein
MTHKIINKNIINIKIENKKHKPKKNKKDKKYKHKIYDNHVNAIQHEKATLQQTNRPQQLDTSTATSREKEGIINQAIMDVKKSNDILLLKDKETNQKLLMNQPLFKDQTPQTGRMIQTDIRSPAFFNNRHTENSNGFTMNEIYSNDDDSINNDDDSINNDNATNDNVVELGEKKKRGRPMKTDNSISNEQLKKNLEYNKKQNEKYYLNKSINPMHIITRNKELNEISKKNREKDQQNIDKITEMFKSPEHHLSQNKLTSILKSNESISAKSQKFLHEQGRLESRVTKSIDSFTKKRRDEINDSRKATPTKLNL